MKEPREHYIDVLERAVSSFRWCAFWYRKCGEHTHDISTITGLIDRVLEIPSTPWIEAWFNPCSSVFAVRINFVNNFGESMTLMIRPDGLFDVVFEQEPINFTSFDEFVVALEAMLHI